MAGVRKLLTFFNYRMQSERTEEASKSNGVVTICLKTASVLRVSFAHNFGLHLIQQSPYFA